MHEFKLFIFLIFQCIYFLNVSFASDQNFAWFWLLRLRGQIRSGSQEWGTKKLGSNQQYLLLHLWESEPFQLGFERVAVEPNSPLATYSFLNSASSFSLKGFSLDVAAHKVNQFGSPSSLMIFGRFPSPLIEPSIKNSNASLITTGYWNVQQTQFNDPSKVGDVCEYFPTPSACDAKNDPGRPATAYTVWPRGFRNQLATSQIFWRISSNAFGSRDSFYFLLNVFGTLLSLFFSLFSFLYIALIF